MPPVNRTFNRVLAKGKCALRFSSRLFGALITLCFILSTAGVSRAQSWSLLAPTGPLPVPRDISAAVYSSASNRLILFGGYPHVTPYINDLWILSDANGLGTPTWTQVIPNGAPGSPPARGGAVMVYDAQNNRAILTGGESTSFANLNDVWVLINADGTTGTPIWTQLNPQGGFPGRESAGAVYDAQSNRLVVFMGSHPGGLCRPSPCIVDPADVWVLTNANGLGGIPIWNQLLASGAPPGRLLGSVDSTYDPANNRLMVFGGFRPAQQQVLNDAWVLTNANGLDNAPPTWTQLSPSGSMPAARSGNTTFYDIQTNRLVIFGGSNGGVGGTLTNFNDVWALDNANGLGGAPAWHQLNPDGLAITPHVGSSGLYDSARNRMILFGGGVNGFVANETWVLSDANGIPASQLKIDAVQPNHGGQGTVTAQVVGGGFQPGATVKLTGLGPDIVGTTVPSASALTATFNLTGAIPGARDVVVTNPGGTSATLANGFIVEQGGAPNISVDIVGRDRIRIGQAQTYYVVVTNRGNIDAAGVPFWIEFPNGVSLDLGFSLLPVPGASASSPAVAQAASGNSSIPFEVSVSGGTVAGLFVPTVAAGSSAFFPLKLAVGSALAPFQIQTWVRPPFLGTMVENAVINDPQHTLLCLADIGSLAFAAYAGPAVIPIDAAANGLLHQLVQSQLASPGTSQVYSSFQFLDTANKLAQNAGLPVPLSVDQFFASAALSATLAQTFVDCGSVGSLMMQSLSIQPVTSLDPNDKVGLLGVGAQQYVSGSTPLTYSIYFGNEPTATAPAQQVTVTDQLDVVHDELDSLSFGPFWFENQLVSPAPFQTNFATTIDLRPATNLLVGVSGNLNMSNGVVTWNLQSLDPSTNQPPTDPTVGLLPPGGEGGVFLSVRAKLGLPTNTQIQNQATIVFDVNPPIATQTWTNTLDNTPPASQVISLPATEFSPSFSVNWSGTDIGSGIQDFTIYASDNGGPFTVWQQNTTSTSATFTGQVGHTYGFYSLARDLVGNVEALKTAAEATTQVVTDTTPPVTTAILSPQRDAAGWNNSNVTVTLSSTDNEAGGTGVKQIQWSLTGAQTGSSSVPGSTATVTISTEGTTTLTYFGTDNAGNIETPKTITINLDKTPPTITGTRTPAANANGWNNTNVTVSFTCADNLSGLAAGSPPAPTVLSAEGAGQSVSGTCADVAGNSATSTVSGINIDKTPPVITASANPATVWPPNGKMVNVTVSGTMADNLSGINPNTATFAVQDSLGLVQPSGPVSVASNGAYSFTISLEARRDGQDQNGRLYTILVSAQDNAGNASSATTTVIVPHDQGN